MTVNCTACNAVLHLHCPSWCCTWLRCSNPRCVWSVYDMDRGVRLDRAGKVEGLAA